VTHVYTHWSGAEQQNFQLTDEDQAEHRKRVAVHKVCAECVSVAQMAAVIIADAGHLHPQHRPGHRPPATLAACERTTCVFQPRAPLA
jgi:hypothetical protein